MRTFLATLAVLAFSSAPLWSAANIERRQPLDVQLTQLVQQPEAYLGMRVRFDATFVQTASLFDPYHTSFTAARYLNLVVWDARARVWEPTVRANPVLTLYYEKNRAEANDVALLPRYAQIVVVGEVMSSFRGQPWINCHSITALPSRGAFTDNAIYHLEQARSLHEEAAYALADEHFVAALGDDLPQAGRAMVLEMQGMARLDANDFEGAEEVLGRALALVEDDEQMPGQTVANLHYLRAQALAEMAELEIFDPAAARELFTRAVAHAERSVALDPAAGDAYAVLGISLAGLERFDEARRQCERAIRLRPDNAEVRWYLGRILDRQGEFDEAIEVLKQGIDLAPKDYRLHKAIAASYFNRARLGGSGAAADVVISLREYDISIRLNDRDPDLFFGAGLVTEYAADRGQEVRIGMKMVPATYAMAIERFQACLAVDESYVPAHIHLARRFRFDDKHDEAVRHFRRALELAPERQDLYQEVATYFWQQDRREDAYRVYELMLARAPGSVEAIYGLGRLSLELRAYEQGIAWHEQLLRVAADHAMAHADLTELKFEAGDTRGALRHAEAAKPVLVDEQELSRVARFEALSHWAHDDVDATLASLERADLADATDPRLFLAQGWALSTKDDRAVEALAAGQRALALGADTPETRELIAWSLHLTGEHAAAAEALRQARIADESVAAYRLGMTLFAKGPEHYEAAEPLLRQAGRLGSGLRRSVYGDARNQVSAALREIVAWQREQAREARAAELRAREEARQRQREERQRQ